MDPGTKVAIFIGGIGTVVGLIAWLLRRAGAAPPPPSEHQQEQPNPYTEE